jgi:predicted RNA-binding Zn-ribbon protein involved in translation (DUF1610 family)
LSHLGFIGMPISNQDHTFLIGPGFLDLLAFTGCAVSIASEPRDGAAFCHVQVPPPASRPLLLFGRNTRPPRCPGCRGRLIDWRAEIERWGQDSGARFTCPNCGQTRPPWQWDWKQQGGLGRQIIRVEEVFPGEASPTAALLDGLERAGGSAWHYFYIQD